jgi:hypothetical protein
VSRREAILNMKQVSAIFWQWRTDFEATPLQQQLQARDQLQARPADRKRKARSRFEQELRKRFGTSQMAKILVASGQPNPALWQALEDTEGWDRPAPGEETGEQQARPVGHALAVRRALQARAQAARARRYSKAAYNAEGCCAECGWWSREGLAQCQYCGWDHCSYCMAPPVVPSWAASPPGGAGQPARTVCRRCPSLDVVDLQNRDVTLCERCHGNGIPPADARMDMAGASSEGMRAQGLWPDPHRWAMATRQCRQCGLWLCKYCCHTDLLECRGDCPSLALSRVHEASALPPGCCVAAAPAGKPQSKFRTHRQSALRG